jgi:hypothetical protein
MPDTDVANANFIDLSMLILAAMQSYALLALYRLKPSNTAVGIGCGLMLLSSVSAPALLSADLYGYVHDSMLGFATYAPPKTPFAGPYHVFDLLYGLGDTTLYGPLWLAVTPLVTFAAPTLLGKILAMRFFSLALFLGLLAALRALALPARTRNIAALNPALMLQFVSNGHNDLIPLDLLLWAAVWIRAQPVLGFSLMVAAGLVKLPYVLLGLPIVAALRSRRAKIAGSIMTLAVVAAISWVIGRAGYAGSLGGHFNHFHPNVAVQLTSVAAVLLIVSAAFGRRRLRAAVWIAPFFSSAIFSWYFIWALPYAVARRRLLGYLLICFPFVSLLIGMSVLVRVWQLNIVLPLIVIVSITWSIHRRRQLGRISRLRKRELPPGADAMPKPG